MANQLLIAATATGAGSSHKLVPRRAEVSTHTIQIDITGAPSAVVVDLEGSLDENSWFQLAQHTMTAGELTDTAAMFHVTNKPVEFVRANLTTLTAGTAPTVTVLHFWGSI